MTERVLAVRARIWVKGESLANEVVQQMRKTARRRSAKALALGNEETPERRLAESHGSLKHRIEDRCEVAGRGIDNPEHLGRRLFLSLIFVTLGCALGKLTFEVGCSGLTNVLSGVGLICGPRRDRPSGRIIP